MADLMDRPSLVVPSPQPSLQPPPQPGTGSPAVGALVCLFCAQSWPAPAPPSNGALCPVPCAQMPSPAPKFLASGAAAGGWGAGGSALQASASLDLERDLEMMLREGEEEDAASGQQQAE